MSHETASLETNNLERISESEDLTKFLVFSLGEELYGCSVLKVKEVIKAGTIKPVPYMAKYFCGVQNLRGQVLGVIDLGMKLGLPKKPDQNGLIVVTETDYGSIGVLIDELAAVTPFPQPDPKIQSAIKTKIAPIFFEGIGHWSGRLVHLINLSGLVQEEDFRLPAM
jgi:purine-binding chemotaxis protein CheW